MRAQLEREAITQLLRILGQDFTHAAAKKMSVDHAHQHDHSYTYINDVAT